MNSSFKVEMWTTFETKNYNFSCLELNLRNLIQKKKASLT